MKHLKKDVLRLAATYLAIIMVMSLLFSGIFYTTAVRELDRRPQHTGVLTGPGMDDTNFSDYLDQRANEGRGVLLIDLLAINIMVLVAGTFISYYLAERALNPIEDSMEAQLQFVSDASHELRTPLTALRTANEVAVRDKKLSVARARTVLEENVHDIVRLQSLTDSMLGLLRDEATERHTMPVSSVVVEAMTIIAPKAVAKQIAVDDQMVKGNVFGNKDGLIRLMVILLDNAVKYSPPETTIAISSKTVAKHTLISITDQGIGMDEETAKHIFTRFYRADSARTSQATDGYGLGLAIARKIVDAHSGRIEVTSAPERGATFTIYIPSK